MCYVGFFFYQKVYQKGDYIWTMSFIKSADCYV